jgi:hypothetical protein
MLLRIKVKLAKDAADYAVNNLNKKIGMLLRAKADDVIWYFKTDKGVSINPKEINVQKYKEIQSTHSWSSFTTGVRDCRNV